MKKHISFSSPAGYSKIHVYHNKKTGRFMVLEERGRKMIEASWDGESNRLHDVVVCELWV